MNSNIFSKYPLNSRWKMNLSAQMAKKPLRITRDTLNQFRTEQRKLSKEAIWQDDGWAEGDGQQDGEEEKIYEQQDRERAASCEEKRAAGGLRRPVADGAGRSGAAERYPSCGSIRQEADLRQPRPGMNQREAASCGSKSVCTNLRNVILWSEILGEPVYRKRKRNHGSQSNSGRR